MTRLFTCLLMLLFSATLASAHEVRPAVGDLSTEQSQLTLELALNVEAFVAGIDLDALADTNNAAEAEDYDALRALSPDALADRFAPVAAEMARAIAITTPGGDVTLDVASVEIGATGDVETLRDSTLVLSGALPEDAGSLALLWPDGYGTLILRQVGVDEGFTGYIDGGGSSGPIQLAGGDALSGWGTFVQYIPVGFDHILPKGLDHILFVLGLFFLSLRIGALLWQVTAFTIAHTVTLALGALGIVVVPGSIVEPIIAASIVYVAVENILARGMTPWRPFVIFAFGLLHGLGFASVLAEFGLPQAQFIPALLGFNVGVELGQLTVIAIAFLLVGYWFGSKPWYRARIAIPASAVIALIGAWWVIERTVL